MRKQYTAQFKAQVVQESLKEEKTLNEIGRLTTKLTWLKKAGLAVQG
jgi:transposase-like protein